MFDTHVHLQFPAYKSDRAAVLSRAITAGVTGCILPGSTFQDSREAVQVARQFSQPACPLYAAVGMHPGDAHEVTPETLANLRRLAQSPQVVAIGEIGLDYYWPNIPDRRSEYPKPARQREAFLAQLELAADLKLPVIIHDRDAHADTLDILQDWVRGGPDRVGTLHSYAGGAKFLQRVLDLGFYVGMDGPVTFSKAVELHELARVVPLDRLLLETDGPYLTPEPYRGQRNEPSYLAYVVERIAKLRHVFQETVINATTQNARRLFLAQRPANPAVV